MASFDQLAKIYEPLERLTFAGRLQQIRCFCIPHIQQCQRGLLIGDGDGRFSSALLKSNPNIQLASIDISQSMLETAKQRAGPNAPRLTTYISDALEFPYPDETYDFIGLHFCLDCFSQNAIDLLLPQLSQALAPGGVIAYSDFKADKPWQKLLVRGLYLCFRVGAGLKTKQLPEVKWSSSYATIAETEILSGLIFSRVLKKS